ncbi:DUF4339 domain-containing protein [Bradyrhizobium sp. CIR48]|uniref:DUF4339 domain-containing protein n=1 Tax=Bradyrhizobium sp. CIR48 TaxID=2663840 RepID=UPI0028A0C87E|nr:DUF4339 domain-containing protein [Bradyrhizobium sp. CIR48]
MNTNEAVGSQRHEEAGTIMSDTTDERRSMVLCTGRRTRKGPVPADRLRELLATQIIDGETPVWRKGLADWQPLAYGKAKRAWLHQASDEGSMARGP